MVLICNHNGVVLVPSVEFTDNRQQDNTFVVFDSLNLMKWTLYKEWENPLLSSRALSRTINQKTVEFFISRLIPLISLLGRW